MRSFGSRASMAYLRDKKEERERRNWVRKERTGLDIYKNKSHHDISIYFL